MSFKDESRFQAAIKAFDTMNAEDPNRVLSGGEYLPKELHDALAMTRWIDTMYPEASESVHLAARCQHLCRWEVPRSSYPEGRAGYLKWRAGLKVFHSEKSSEVLRTVGYPEEIVARVAAINLKEGLKINPEVQQIEDALCLVFLETQYAGYITQWEEAKIVRILKKTWSKMSECGHEAALSLQYSDEGLALIKKALSV